MSYSSPIIKPYTRHTMQPTIYAKTVIKRNGREVSVEFDKITRRIKALSNGLSVEPSFVTQEVIRSMKDKMHVCEIDELAAQSAAFMVKTHIDYMTLAGRLVVSNLHKETPSCFSDAMEMVHYQNLHPPLVKNDENRFLSKEFMSMVRKHAKVLDATINHNADYAYDYFGMCTLLNGYLNKINIKETKSEKTIERPQYAAMRVALFLNMDNIPMALKTYQVFSERLYTHASPTLFNAGKPDSQMSSCFVAGTLVHTDKGPKPIEKIEIGDMVITHKGNWKPVVQLHKNTLNNRQLIYMSSDFKDEVTVTDNHRFWCVTDDNRIPRWISAIDIFVFYSSQNIYIGTNGKSDSHINNISVSGDKSMSFVKITTKQLVNLSPDYVYTLGVEDDHSYCAGGLIAENCFLLQIPEDSLDSIYDTLKQTARISKNAGGIGLSVHKIRASGAIIKSSGGLGDGLVPMLKVYNSTARYVNQGGKRKGAFAIYLEPWHADIFAFLDLKKNRGNDEERARDLHYAMWIPDLFMIRVENNDDWSLFSQDTAPGLSEVWGDKFDELYKRYEQEGRALKVVKARKIWNNILDSQIETGEPYMLYKDSCNRKSNQQNLGTIESSNLCVAPETPILTRNGYYPISELEDEKVQVWNGEQWSDVDIIKTSDSSPLMKIHFSDGSDLECTHYHKFYTSLSYWKVNPYEKRAHELQVGDKLWKFQPPLAAEFEFDSKEDIKYPYTHGFFCGDGTYGKDGKPRVALYGVKKQIIPYLNIRTMSGVETAQGLLNVMLPLDLSPKFKVPVNATLDNKLRWLEGICDADGCVHGGGPNQQLQIASIHKSFLLDIRLMLHTMGIYPKIAIMHHERKTVLPGRSPSSQPDGKGGKKEYDMTKELSFHHDCQECSRINITSVDLFQLIQLGFSPKRLQITNVEPQRDARAFVSVVSIEKYTRDSPTYCFNEPLKHMGVFNGILTGNCTEILEYTSKDDTAVCNLCSICLPMFLEDGKFNHQKLFDVVYLATRNLNRVVDLNYYPIIEAKNSNLRHRPIGIGVQGLADVFNILMFPFESNEAKDLNKEIFETIYFAALTSSKDLAKEHGFYETYPGSPVSKGVLQYDMWNVTPGPRWDWAQLKEEIKTHGLRNSLLLAPMPTASTSQIMGFNEGAESVTRNIYVRRTSAGEFIVVNRHLARILSDQGLWTKDIIDQIIAHDGSIQLIDDIPYNIKQVFKTSFEIKTKTVIDMSADRGAYICQSQSMNLWIEKPTPQILNSVHFYAWKKGLKTGMYYLRSQALCDAQKFTLDPTVVENAKKKQQSEKTSAGSDEKVNSNQEETSSNLSESLSTSGSGVTDITNYDNPKKIYSKNSKVYVCTENECVMCGS